MEKILVSACLLGENCKYSGGSNYHEGVVNFLKENEGRIEAIPVCPEADGGLGTPRAPAEIRGNAVVTKEGEDVTDAFIKGAKKTAELAGTHNCRLAILKERSPSCGSGSIYDGTFTGTIVAGDGKTVEYLKRIGVTVYGESEVEGLKENHADLYPLV